MAIRPKPGDFLLAGVLLLIILLVPVVLAQSSSGEVTAIITQDGEELARIRLTGLAEATRISYSGDYPGTILAENGRIRFEEATCPDQVCVNTGWLTTAGSTAACLPGRVLIRMEGSGAEDVDVRLR